MGMGIAVTFWRAVFKWEEKRVEKTQIYIPHIVMGQAQALFLCCLILLEEGENAERF